jgi:hypothetical protein
MLRSRSLVFVLMILCVVMVGGFFGSGVMYSQGARPQPLPSPNAPNPEYPPGFEGPEQKGKDKRTMDKQAQADIRADVDRMQSLINELKEEVSKTDTGSTLSLSVVNKAKQIEKLAKQVKERAKG